MTLIFLDMIRLGKDFTESLMLPYVVLVKCDKHKLGYASKFLH